MRTHRRSPAKSLGSGRHARVTTPLVAMAAALYLLVPTSSTPAAESAKTTPAGTAQSAPAAQAAPFDLPTVLRKLDALYRAGSSESSVQLTVTKDQKDRQLEMRVWTRGDDRALIVIDKPPRETGTATLRVGNDMWNYLPRASRTIRIPPSMMLTSWMGSDFTNDDLVRKSSYEKDFTSQVVGPSKEPAGWLIQLDARPDLVGLWKKLELIVSEDGSLPLEIRYYDRRDRLSRNMYFSDVKQFGDRRVPTVMRLVPQDTPGQQTELRYLKLQFDADVPEATFSLSQLEKSH